MFKKLKYCLLFFVIALCFFNAIGFLQQNNLYAQTDSFEITKINLTLPSNVDLNGISSIDASNFYFTNNSTTLYICNESSYEPIVFKDLEDGKDYPTENIATILKNNTTFVYSKTQPFANQNIIGLYKVSENGQAEKDPYTKVYANSISEQYDTYLSEVADICSDNNSCLYMLDINNKAILTFNYTTNRIEVFKDLTTFLSEENLTLTINSKLCCTISGTTMFILIDNRVYKLNGYTKEIEQVILPQELDAINFVDIACDASQSIFFLSNENEKSNLHKLSRQNILTQISLNNLHDEFFIEQYCGKMFFKANNEIFEFGKTNFIASTLTFPEPINFNEQAYLTNTAKIVTTKNDTCLLSSPYALSSIATLPEDTQLVVLENNIATEPDYIYCLYETEQELTFGYILKNSVKEYASLNAMVQQNKKTFVVTNVYKYPTKNSTKLTTIAENTIVKIVGDYSFTTSNSPINFYCVEIIENGSVKTGYIDKNLVYSLNSTEIEYTGGEETPNKYNKFIEYLLIILALTILEVVTISIIVKKFSPNKKKDK